MSGPSFDIAVTATALRTLDRLPESVAAAMVEFITGPLAEAPRRVGHELRRDLAGLWSARRGQYRVIYSIEDVPKRVTVMRVDHRADVYRPR